MRFKLPEKFPLRFKEMDQESKAMAGVLVAFAIVVLGAVGLSQGQAGTPSLGPGKKPNMTAPSGGLPSEAIEEEPGKKKQKGKPKGKGSKGDKSLDKLADSIDSSASGGAAKSEAPTSTPVAPAPKSEAPAAGNDSSTTEKPASEKPASRKPASENPTSEKREKARKSQPKPAPSTLTSARVRALKNGQDISSVGSQLGPSLGRADLASRYGKEASDGMLAQEPAGRPCRYYALAPGEPAPLVRLCFDANGHLLTREFVAPQS